MLFIPLNFNLNFQGQEIMLVKPSDLPKIIKKLSLLFCYLL